ncbi:hypothetical protein HRR83_008834 [Exophiala dermatitidis]|uniref:Uncharacterized protein n=2 Tax=Exophiala dermatitidis TaxID=5970 RepID=H6BXF9_EXODN|nr:uncharacterized protein HMPREF1120_03529 [Exophiala dermatitidis NIH/UT8656]KAJ4503684.1 hypothetical protein HRR73_008989 [Exophiala dermatitidis]EHY55390.1 hypothetical protein HMPREF1120_03529 [Exophiala dermatitidis NIH/UT8656]KAJ4508362.1 hypothetical protein HRR74_007761 [Exophiala dermatitidis]KAJ4533420.1 hypothetical protein HRR77_008582 [Exophiala dermatitidis]KAJ4540281.1 hypothetical protein HRR76_003691 [Exophiala dermatitidis]
MLEYDRSLMLLSPGICTSMASQQQQHPHAAAQVAEKVMRRVEIAKVARNLQDCLAFASFKAQNGWQDRTLSTIEPEFTEKLKRKRPFLEDDNPSDGSSETDDDYAPASSIAKNRFSRPSENPFKVPQPPFASRKRVRSSSTNGFGRQSGSSTWKQDHRLSQSSPVLGRSHSFRENNNLYHADPPSLPTRHNNDDSPMFDVHSDDDEHDIPMPSFADQPSSSILSSSPPRTPPPTKRLVNVNAKAAGADLLLYLANSPSRSPAINFHRASSSSKEPPSTPPTQHSHLPSSVMTTPGTHLGLFNGALQTPGQNFNLADFCNVTPSPAQAQWGGRTPSVAKTPSRFARRSLNFDALQPPSGSPTLQRKTPTTQGLALQLGEELIPRS